MTFRQKWDNYWYYYKFHTFFGLFILIVITVLTVDAINTAEPDMGIGYIGGDYVNEAVFSDVLEDIENIVGDINGDGKTKIRFDFSRVPEKMQAKEDLSMNQRAFLSFVTGDIRIYLLEERFVEQYKEGFHPLEEVLPPDKLEGGIKSDGKTVAVRLDKSILKDAPNLDSSKIYACLRTITENDKRKENIDEIFSSISFDISIFNGRGLTDLGGLI